MPRWREPISKFTFSTFGFNPAGPARWIQFDSDQTLVWRAGPEGQANTASDEFASVQQALAAWTNDPNSRILTTYAGTMANPVICNNPPQSGIGFAGHVCWNDPAGRIGGSFNCNGGGTLAIGGSFAGTPSHSVNGQLWYRRSDAFVVIQDGAGCFMDGDNGADGAELLTHEIGHSLAFGHACGDSESPACNSSAVLNQATMRAFAHGDGRGRHARRRRSRRRRHGLPHAQRRRCHRAHRAGQPRGQRQRQYHHRELECVDRCRQRRGRLRT
jgi:hypothetical protein